MPICINFLAEQQAQEDQRRKDPVKRVYAVGVLLLGAMFCWYGFLEMKAWGIRSEASINENKYKSIETNYLAAVANKELLNLAGLRLESVALFGQERMLWGNAVGALQHIAMRNVPLAEFRVDQVWRVTEAVPAKTNTADGSITSPRRPATSKESVVVHFTARDFGPTTGGQAGDQMDVFRERLAAQPFFKSNLTAVRAVGRSDAQVDSVTGRKFVEFSLEVEFTGKER